MIDRLRQLLTVLLAVLAAGLAHADSSLPYQGLWRITRGVPAPWADATTSVAPGFVGRSVRLAESRTEGPGVLSCTDARYEDTSVEAGGLFQGTLPAPAARAAEALGLAHFPVQGFSLACSSGLFEFHAAEPNSLLLALDNVVWTLDRSAGTQAAPESPEGLVQVLLEAHFAGDMGFLPRSVATKQAWLSRALQGSIDAYFARPRPADEVPPVDGDPFTDSQEYPVRFAVRGGKSDGPAYEVPVDFADAYQQKRAVYRLIPEDGVWRLDDLRFEHSSFRELLAQ